MIRKPSTISRLRTVLLLAFVLAVAAIGGLFMFGQAGKSTGPRAPEEADTEAGEGTTFIGDDFDYTFTEREKPVFRIRGDSIRADRQETIFLDGVAVTFYDDQGQPFHIESKEASFNRTSNEGRLQGRVVLKGPSGLELRTAVLQIRDKGQTLFCPRPVELRYAGRYIVNGQRMKVEVENEVFILQGQARVNSVPGTPNPVMAMAQRAIYERKRRLLRIEGNADLRRGVQSLQASRISAYLSEDESAIVFVRALWNVKGRTGSLQQAASSGASSASTVRFSGKDLAVILEPQGNQVRKVELEGGVEDRATLETVSGGNGRTLTAGRIEGVLAEGVLSEADAFRGVEIREHIKTGSHPGLRVARSRRAEAAFKPDGHIDTATLFGDEVTFEDPQVRGKGNRATLDMDARRADLFGNPVEVTSEKGTLVAPRVFYDTENEILNAQGGVRAVLEQASDAELAGSPLAGGEGPVRVESREAFWRQQPSSFLFRGDVRAWRGENLMLTEQLRGDREQDRLTASGGVKTIWVPEEEGAGAPKPKGAAAGGKGKPGTPEASRAPIEVLANELVYQEGKGFLTYTGAVRVEQQGKTLNCQRLEVELNKEKKPRIMTCTGQARLNDPKEGRNIEGDKAVYRLEDRRVEFTGNRVTMRDRQGNQVQGPRVLYSIDDGKVEVKGKDEAKAAAGATGG